MDEAQRVAKENEDNIHYMYGRKIYWVKEREQFYYFDTDEKTNAHDIPGPCPHCKKDFIYDKALGYIDPCLGKLPGIKFACCGHGVRNGYLAFNNNTCVYFNLREVLTLDLPNNEF